MHKIELLKSTFIFSRLNDELIQKLSKDLEEINLSKDEYIFKEGDTADAFFIINKGNIIITKQIGPEQKKILTILCSGDVFGEMAIFTDSPRTANAIAQTDSNLLKINRKDFLDFIQQEPQAGLSILTGLLQVAMERLEQTSKELATIYYTGKIISSGNSLNDIAKDIIKEIMLAIPESEDANIFLYNEFNEEFIPIIKSEGVKEIPTSDYIIRFINENPSGIIVNDTKTLDEQFFQFFSNSKSLIFVPLIKTTTILGFILLRTINKHQNFKNNHILLLSSIANQFSEAIENIKYRQEEKDRKRLNESHLIF